jgi:hypothetical protein
MRDLIEQQQDTSIRGGPQVGDLVMADLTLPMCKVAKVEQGTGALGLIGIIDTERDLCVVHTPKASYLCVYTSCDYVDEGRVDNVLHNYVQYCRPILRTLRDHGNTRLFSERWNDGHEDDGGRSDGVSGGPGVAGQEW